MTFRNACKLHNQDEIQSKLDKSFWKVIHIQVYNMKPNFNKFGHEKFVNIEAVNQNGNLNYFTHEEVKQINLPVLPNTNMNAIKAQEITQQAIRHKQYKIEQQAQEVIKYAHKLIEETSLKGEYTCIIRQDQGAYPDTNLKFGVPFVVQKTPSEHALYIIKTLNEVNFVTKMRGNNIYISWEHLSQE